MNKTEMISHLNTLDMLLANRCSKQEIAEDLKKLDYAVAVNIANTYGFYLVQKELEKLSNTGKE